MILILQHVEIEGPGTLGDFFKNSDWECSIVDLSSSAGSSHKAGLFFEDLSRLEGLIVLGGPMNVYQDDKYPFLTKEVELLKRAVRQEVPTLGICLGAQLLARALGAPVVKAVQEEIGWHRVALTEEAASDPLFKSMGSKFDVFQWHEDAFEIPERGVLLAQGNPCRNQAFRTGSCAWGLQFHPEMNSKMLKTWLQHYPVKVNKSKIVFDYFERQQQYIFQAKMLYLNFARVIEQRSVIKA
jgi:GMP synthase-like glutamine amidotransferase